VIFTMLFQGVLAASVSGLASGQLFQVPLDIKVPLSDIRPTTEEFVHPTLCDSSVNQTAGYIAAAKGVGAPKYFFWLFESQNDPVNDPLLMWLSGGPGCSSQLALFAENGPCSVTPDGQSTTVNDYSWHRNANAMWVDQPAGVGFSTGLGTHNEKGVAENMFTFLQGFFTKLPRFQNNDFYIFGESYGGHYVPAISHRIWEGNMAGEGVTIPMKGIGIGNGLTNPEIQYQYYAEMGHTGGQSEGGHAPAGVLGNNTYKAQLAAMPACVAAVKACNSNVLVLNSTVCVAAAEACNIIGDIPYKASGMNPYDMRLKCEKGNLCYDFDHVTTYLNTKEVQQQLGTTGTWGSCNMAVNLLFQLAGDWMVNYHTKIPDLLHAGIDVLIYAGDEDYICNWLGNKAWTKELEWNLKEDFNSAEDIEWQMLGETVAKHRNAGNFHFMQVYYAGHMVPMDKPSESLEMVNRFINRTLSVNHRPSEFVL